MRFNLGSGHWLASTGGFSGEQKPVFYLEKPEKNIKKPEEKKTGFLFTAGWWFFATPLKNLIESQLGWLFHSQLNGETKTCSKPPTSPVFFFTGCWPPIHPQLVHLGVMNQVNSWFRFGDVANLANLCSQIWLVVQCAHLEKWWTSSMGRMTSLFFWENNVWNTTNQYFSMFSNDFPMIFPWFENHQPEIDSWNLAVFFGEPTWLRKKEMRKHGSNPRWFATKKA